MHNQPTHQATHQQPHQAKTNSKKLIQHLAMALCAMTFGAFTTQALADAPPPTKHVKAKKISKPKAKAVKKTKKISKPVAKLGTVKLSPQMREMDEAIYEKTLSIAFINKLRKSFKLLDANLIQQNQLPKIITGDDDKFLFTQNDYVYAQHPNLQNQLSSDWQVYQAGAPIYQDQVLPVDAANSDMDKKITSIFSKKDRPIIAYRGMYGGEANLVSQDNQQLGRFFLKSTVKEVNKGDYLLPKVNEQYFSSKPFLNNLQTSILAIENAAHYGAQGSVVLLNKGANDGLNLGHVLEIYPQTRYVEGFKNNINTVNGDGKIEASKAAAPIFALSQVKKGEAIIFDVTPNLSYAYVLRTDKPVEDKDILTNIQNSK